MTGLIVAAVVTSLLAVALVVAPMLRGRRTAPTPRRDFDLAVYVEQLAEIDRDRERGIIAPAEAEAARIELKRRILALEPPATKAAAATARKPEGGRRFLAAAGLALALPAAAAIVYLAVGQPGSADRPLAARKATGDLAGRDEGDPTTRAALVQTVAELERFLAERPDQAEGWLLLGRARLTIDRADDAVAALARAQALAPGRADITAAYGEAQVVAAGGQVTDAAADLLRQALQADPRNAQARYYLALAAAQAGDLRRALQGWVDLLYLSPPEAPWLPQVARQIAAAAADLGIDGKALPPPTREARALAATAPPAAVPPGASAGGPTAADVQAAQAMSAADREAMIRGMVGRLAARLEANPNDAQGWLRLAQAWDVLGERAKAADARARAAAVPGR